MFIIICFIYCLLLVYLKINKQSSINIIITINITTYFSAEDSSKITKLIILIENK